MPQDNKKLVSQIQALHNKFLLELAELEQRRQEILDSQKNNKDQKPTLSYGD